MTLNLFNFYLFVLLFLSLLFFYNYSSTLNLLILSELYWITLYLLVTVLTYTYSDVNLLTLSLFFLIFSASEISIAFILLNLQTLVYSNSFFDNKFYFNSVNHTAVLFNNV